MGKPKRIRDYGITIGTMKPGVRNTITDVDGVKVGHATLNQQDIQTGVTAIFPHHRSLFRNKVTAASHVFNGFGKTIGTVQINELGTIETPILLTNTLSVGKCADALIDYILQDHEEIGRTAGTVNPVVGECNDMFLNDIRKKAVDESHVLTALETAAPDFEEGAVGAGRGMTCFGLKGGIGSSSRVFRLPDGEYTVGVLVLTNFGRMRDFILAGKRVGSQLETLTEAHTSEKDKGSIMMIAATDLPVTSRQLKRIIKRMGVGLSRTGSYMGNGSGDIAIGFSTANVRETSSGLRNIDKVDDSELDLAFEAIAEATEEAILNSMITAETTEGREGNIRYSLQEFIHRLSL